MCTLKKIDQEIIVNARESESIANTVMTISHYPSHVLAPAIVYLSHVLAIKDANDRGETIDGPENMTANMRLETRSNLTELLDSLLEEYTSHKKETDANIVNSVH
tara:strand:- start:1761 stop:2075 length:315 start_codon:yes stop_codon:yes gene_type:complete